MLDPTRTSPAAGIFSFLQISYAVSNGIPWDSMPAAPLALLRRSCALPSLFWKILCGGIIASYSDGTAEERLLFPNFRIRAIRFFVVRSRQDGSMCNCIDREAVEKHDFRDHRYCLCPRGHLPARRVAQYDLMISWLFIYHIFQAIFPFHRFSSAIFRRHRHFRCAV